MAGTTISTSGTVGVKLTLASQNPVLVTATGTITTSGAFAIDDAVSTPGTITNNGKLVAAQYGVIMAGPTSAVTNFGSIAATAAGGIGVRLGNGGSVNNGASGSTGWSITGGSYGVLIQTAAGVVNNFGTITGTNTAGIAMTAGQITNGQSSSAAWLITGAGGVNIFNGGTVTNWGSIVGTSGFGARINGGGGVANGSAAATGRLIKGVNYGVVINGGTAGAGTVTNFGSIAATAAGGIGVRLGNGGSVNNGASGSTGWSITGGSYGVLIQTAAGVVNNFGTITGTVGIDLAVSGTVVNAGTIASTAGAAGTAIKLGPGTSRLVEDPGAVIIGKMIGAGSATTLELGSGSTAGSLGGLGTSITNFGTVSIDAGASWTLTGANTVPNVTINGTVAIGIGGSLDVSSALDPTSSGIFQLTAQGSLEIAAILGSSLKIQFLGSAPANKLVIDASAKFGLNVGSTAYAGPLLEDFTSGDMIDLKTIASAGLTLNYSATSGDLQFTASGSILATLQFQNSSLGAGAFHTAADGSGGTLLTHS